MMRASWSAWTRSELTDILAAHQGATGEQVVVDLLAFALQRYSIEQIRLPCARSSMVNAVQSSDRGSHRTNPSGIDLPECDRGRESSAECFVPEEGLNQLARNPFGVSDQFSHPS